MRPTALIARWRPVSFPCLTAAPLALLITGLLLASCRGPTAPRAAGRTFTVISVGGRLLPTTVRVEGRGSCVETPLRRSELAFLTDGWFELRLWNTDATDASPAVFRDGFVQEANGDVNIEGIGHGTFRGAVLNLSLEPGLVCDKFLWRAVLKEEPGAT